MIGVGVPQIVKPKIRDARLSASRSEAVRNVHDGLAIPENIV
jgi:hypothetical protein